MEEILMITLRKAAERGHADHGWLDTHHTFSFATYQDPRHMGFRSLRVMNEDRVSPGMGFGRHGHRDMEIVSYVLEGALAHQDSMGNASTVQAGQFQMMSAGSGIEHSEFNPSGTEPVHFYQIWVYPRSKGATPRYKDLLVSDQEKRGVWKLVAAPEPENGAFAWDQDARLNLTRLTPGESIAYPLAPGRHAWVQVLSGAAEVNGETLRAGDGAALSEEAAVSIKNLEEGELLLSDLA
jgi:redox-sensitive bicupin YhaK (pirin superfamily)